ncbi:MAG TPA: hypothetical protein VM243_05345 [Phycisphaerae bacterium]|nr:hypothetical protein [Phycisphaerae bacterium]
MPWKGRRQSRGTPLLLMAVMAGLILSSAQALEPVNEPLFALTPGSGTILNGGQGTDDILDPNLSAEDTGGPGPQVHVPAGWISSGGIGFQIDALSNDHASLLVPTPVRIIFSVDANAVGAAGTAVASEAAAGQAAGDLFVSRNWFNLMNPAPVPGPDGNVLAVNQPAMSLAPTAAPGVGPAGAQHRGDRISHIHLDRRIPREPAVTCAPIACSSIPAWAQSARMQKDFQSDA